MKKRIISLLILLILIMPSVFADKSTVLYSFDFNNQVTWSRPDGFSVSGEGVNIVVPDQIRKSKAMRILSPSGGAAYAELPVSGDVKYLVIQARVRTEAVSAEKKLFLIKDSKNRACNLLSLTSDGYFALPDGRKPQKYSADKWYTVSAVINIPRKRYDVYIDNIRVSDAALENKAFDSLAFARFQVEAGAAGAQLLFDYVRLYEGREIAAGTKFPASPFNHEEGEEPTFTADNGGGNTIYINDGFENAADGSPPTGWTINLKGANSIKVVSDTKSKNKYILAAREENDPYMDYNISGFSSNKAVFEIRFCSADASNQKYILMKDSDGQFCSLLRFTDAGVILAGASDIGSYSRNKWYNIGIIFDFGAKTMDAYIDGKLIKAKIPLENQAFGALAVIRAQIPNAGGSSSINIDDVKLYAGNEFKDLSESDGASAENPNFKLITPETEVISTVKNSVAMISGANRAYNGKERVIIDAAPCAVNGKIFVPIRFTAESLGAKVSWDNNSQAALIEKDGKVINIDCSDGGLINGRAYSSADLLAEKMNVQLKTDIKGLAVFGGAARLGNTQIKDIYDWLLYERPSKERIAEDFQPRESVHPRILANAEDFAEILSRKEQEPFKTWSSAVINSADGIMNNPVTTYKLDPGGRLLDESRRVLNCAQTLGMAYILTNDTKYAERLWREYTAAGNFSDWNSQHHFLDTAEMTVAFSIGYDWLYDYWDKKQRDFLANAIIEKALKPGEKCYKGVYGSSGDWVKWDWNWNQVCNGGLSVGALAVMEYDPDLCLNILEQAFLSLETMLGEFAPDGAWKEGPGYWQYTAQYLVYHIAALNSALGTNYDYFKHNSIDQTGYFPIYGGSAQGAFNFHDAGSGIINAPQLFFFARELRDGALANARLNDMKLSKINPNALDILWYEPSDEQNSQPLPLDRYFRYTEAASFRSGWNDKTALFTAIHAGDNNVSHGMLDSGTFVLDALGERFITQLGPDDYNLPGYFDGNGARWDYYRCGVQGQNSISMNPISERGQIVTAFTHINNFVAKDKGGFAVIDMSPAFGSKVNKAKRALKLEEGRDKVIVQDELDIKGNQDIWWFAHTKAEVKIAEDGQSAVLSIDGKTLYASLNCSVKTAKFRLMDAAPLAGSANPNGQNKNDGIFKLVVNIPKAKGKASIEVAFTPIYNQKQLDELSNAEKSEIIPIDKWEISDGKIEKPRLTSLSVDGKPLSEFSKDTLVYDYKIPYNTSEIPQISAEADGLSVGISQAASIPSTAELVVTDSDNNKAYYSVRISYLPIIGQPSGTEKYKAVSVTASDEPQPENGKSNVIDSDMNTRWSAMGTQYIILDLGEVKAVNAVGVAHYLGDTRYNIYAVAVSDDGVNYKTVFNGQSSGETTEIETNFIGNKKARYIQIRGYGNSTGPWNSYSEIEVYGGAR